MSWKQFQLSENTACNSDWEFNLWKNMQKDDLTVI